MALLRAAPLLLLLGCSVDFGGRCTEDKECTGEQTCSEGYCLPTDADPDAAPDAEPDSEAPDAVVDAAPDLTVIDAAPDLAVDAAPDTAPDLAVDAAPDAAPDLAVDAAPDAAVRSCEGPIEDRSAWGPEGRPCVDLDTLAYIDFEDPGYPIQGANEPVEYNDGPSGLEAVAAGRFGQAARFPGTGDERMVIADSIGRQPPLTIEAWAAVEAGDGLAKTLYSTLDVVDVVGVREDAFRRGFELQLDIQNGRAVPVLRVARPGEMDDVMARNGKFRLPELSFSPDVWHYVALSIHRGEMADTFRFVVTVDEASVEVVSPFVGEGFLLWLGSRAERIDEPFQGRLDEVRVSVPPRATEDLEGIGALRPE